MKLFLLDEVLFDQSPCSRVSSYQERFIKASTSIAVLRLDLFVD